MGHPGPTLAGSLNKLGTSLSRFDQFTVQLLGVVVCGLWSFGIAWLLFRITRRFLPLRASKDAEKMGLNLAEHGAQNELHQLLEHMRQHEKQGDCLLYTSPSPRDATLSRMPSSA